MIEIVTVVVVETVTIVLQVQETEIEIEIVIDVVVETEMIVLQVQKIEIVIEIVVVATDAIFVDSGSNIKTLTHESDGGFPPPLSCVNVSLKHRRTMQWLDFGFWINVRLCIVNSGRSFPEATSN